LQEKETQTLTQSSISSTVKLTVNSKITNSEVPQKTRIHVDHVLGNGVSPHLHSGQCAQPGVGSQCRFHHRSSDSSDFGECGSADQVGSDLQKSEPACVVADAVGVRQSLRADCDQHGSDFPDRSQFQLQRAVEGVLRELPT